MRPRLAAPLVPAFLAAAALTAATAAPVEASRNLRVGIFDDAQSFYGPPSRAFAQYAALRVQVVRITLHWGGAQGVARSRPRNATNPADRAYSWRRYDRIMRLAASRKIKIVFTIYGTPRWANGGKRANTVPKDPADLRDFASAAARRYSGKFRARDGKQLPAVRDWLAWNEPNNPVFLTPQYRRTGGRWIVQSAKAYARICNAVYAGVHGTGIRGEKVACGVTAPRGNDSPTSTRPSVSPLAFLRATKRAGLRRFDAWAHHPHLASPAEANGLATAPSRRIITLSNIGRLDATIRKLYGKKRLWLTEYGVQTRPQDKFFGVSYVRQAAALRKAYRIARNHPRVDMLVWFMLVDEAKPERWQSGLLTLDRKRKPSYASFREVARTSPSR